MNNNIFLQNWEFNQSPGNDYYMFFSEIYTLEVYHPVFNTESWSFRIWKDYKCSDLDDIIITWPKEYSTPEQAAKACLTIFELMN